MVLEPTTRPEERRHVNEQITKLRGRVEQIRRYPIFSDLSDEELFEVARLTALRAYRKDRTLFYEDEASDATYLVKHGQVKLVRTDEDGREFVLGIFTSGQMVGGMPALEGETYPASAVAITDSTAYVIKRGNFLALIDKYPIIAVNLLHHAGQHIRRLQENLYNLTHQSVEQRAAGLLLDLAARHGRRTPNGLRLDLNLSRSEMADLIGATRESMARALSRFASDGAIHLERRSIVLLDEDALRHYLVRPSERAGGDQPG